MPRPALVSKADLEKAMVEIEAREGRKATNRELADLLTERLKVLITEQRVNQTKQRHGLTKAQLDHRGAVPWSLKLEDQSSTEAKYLRWLSTLAQHRWLPMELYRPAAGWARRLVKEGYDIRYDADNVAGERWVIFHADPEDWHLRRVLDEAKSGLAQMIEDRRTS